MPGPWPALNGTSMSAMWSIDEAGLGAFVHAIPAPLGVGKVEFADGTEVTGFLCEPHALADAPEITHLGGWRAYRADGLTHPTG